MIVGIDDVRQAAERIRGRVHRTPIHTSHTLDERVGASVFFKCENLQKVGAFKARGATNAVFALDDASARRGVVAHSSGNHGAALAYAARSRGVPCTVVMPEDAPTVKVDAVRGYGAEVVFCAQTERDATAARVVEERGAEFVHPFENPYVIAGQGTAALELVEDVPDLDAIVVPVGGGGLLAGTAIVVRELLGGAARTFGAEPAAVDDAHRSFRTGVRQPRVASPRTWADGLLTGLGEPNFAIGQACGVDVLVVDEDEMLDAAELHLTRMKLVVEPSCGTVLAALIRYAERFRGQRVGAVLSGGNTDFAWLADRTPPSR